MNDGKFTNYLPTGMTVKDTTRRMEILDMCWEYNNEEKVRKICPSTLIFYAVSIRPAAGCKYFLTIRPALLFCTPNRFISGQGRCPGRLCHVPNVRFRVWYRFWLLYDIKHNCYQI